MNRTIAIACLSAGLLTAATNLDAWAQLGSGKGKAQGGTMAAVVCTVASVDMAALRFDCKNNAGRATYIVVPATTFALGGGGGSIASLRVGDTVAVRYHTSGSQFIADSVTAQ